MLIFNKLQHYEAVVFFKYGGAVLVPATKYFWYKFRCFFCKGDDNHNELFYVFSHAVSACGIKLIVQSNRVVLRRFLIPALRVAINLLRDFRPIYIDEARACGHQIFSLRPIALRLFGRKGIVL